MSATNARLDPAPSRILIRGLNWLGDAVMTTPAIQRLRDAYPEAHITLLTHEKLADIWRSFPYIDAVETFGEKDGALAIGRRMRAKKFDLGVALPNSPRAALELWRAGIPERLGYRAPWRSWMLTRAVRRRTDVTQMRKRTEAEIRRLIDSNDAGETAITPDSHHIHHYLHLMAAIGASPEPTAPKMALADEKVGTFAETFLPTNSNVGRRRWLGLNPGAEYGPAKRWPAECFIEAAVKLQKTTGCGWIVFGAKGNNDAERIADAIRRQTSTDAVCDLVGKTSLLQLCAGLKYCAAVLTNDSGPMHAAAALGTPVVVPFGSTSIELTGPGLPGDSSTHKLLSADAPCAPCFLRECPVDFRCMNDIAVEQVVEAVLSTVQPVA